MKLLNYIVYALVRAFLALTRFIPMRFTFWWVRGLSRLAYRLAKGRRALTLYNLELALGRETTPEERERIGRLSFENMFLSIGELLHYNEIHMRNLDQHFTFAGTDILERYLAQKQGVFLIGGHLGGWTTMSLIFRFPQMPAVYLVAKGLGNPRLQGLLDYIAAPFNVHIISGKGLGRLIEERVAQGNICQFWMDQEARRDQGTFVQFFGQDAATFAVPGYLAWKNQIPLVPYWIIRRKPGYFHVILREPLLYQLTDDKDENNRRVAQAIASEVERAIREHPEQWLWAHNRWRRRPDGTRVELFTKKKKRSRGQGPAPAGESDTGR